LPDRDLAQRNVPYTGSITVTGGGGIAPSPITVTIIVGPAGTAANLQLGTIQGWSGVTQSNSGSQPARNIPISNTGNTAATGVSVTLSGTDPNSFVLGGTTQNLTIQTGTNNVNTQATVRPAANLAPGRTHTATINVSGPGVTTRQLTISVTVGAAGTGGTGAPGFTHNMIALNADATRSSAFQPASNRWAAAQ
jgi:hypothetical protein